MSSNKELMARRAAAIPQGVANVHGIFAERALGSELWDVEGKRYIDFAAGIGVLNTGHCHPKVMARVEAQMQQFTHTCFHVSPYESYVELAERLNAAAPGDAANKTALFTTGAEAVENAIKFARAATGRSGVIAFNGSFHGRTLMALGLTGKVAGYKTGFGPFPGEVYHAPFPNALHGVSVADALKGLDNLLKVDIDPTRVAAMIVEPVQGEGGFNVAPAEFMQALRQCCDEHGILLIADEVQAGIARTGTLFATEHTGVVPDMTTLAKGLAGGFPLSAVVGRAEVLDAAGVGGIGGTYAGNPLACAAALGVLEAIESEDLLARSTAIGERLRGGLSALAKDHACIGDVRGLGAMVAMELFHDAERTQPAPELARAVVDQAIERGLIILPCGTYGNVVRMLSPVTSSNEIVDEALQIIGESLAAAVS